MIHLIFWLNNLMIHPESNWYLMDYLAYFARMPVQEDTEKGTDELRMCCGQLLTNKRDVEHSLGDGEEDLYMVGGLSIELECCPHRGCGARFLSLMENLRHQDTIHHAILSYVCAACRGIYVTEGAFICHVICGHCGPAGFE